MAHLMRFNPAFERAGQGHKGDFDRLPNQFRIHIQTIVLSMDPSAICHIQRSPQVFIWEIRVVCQQFTSRFANAHYAPTGSVKWLAGVSEHGRSEPPGAQASRHKPIAQIGNQRLKDLLLPSA